MLLQIMGFSLRNDDLPGENVFLETTSLTNDDFNLRHSGTDDSVEESYKREQINLVRVKRVFEQLSNNTGTL